MCFLLVSSFPILPSDSPASSLSLFPPLFLFLSVLFLSPPPFLSLPPPSLLLPPPPLPQVKNYAAIYLVDITEVSDFNKMYELYDPCTVMFFYRNKHIMIDLGTGNNNKINWALEDSQEMVDIVETVYRGASKGRGLVVSPKDYSTKYRY